MNKKLNKVNLNNDSINAPIIDKGDSELTYNGETLDSILTSTGWELAGDDLGLKSYDTFCPNGFNLAFDEDDKEIGIVTGEMGQIEVWNGTLKEFIDGYEGFSSRKGLTINRVTYTGRDD